MPYARQKKIAAINDISGYGRCALTVSIPIISALKVQCCPVPTSILSNHTGYEDFFFDDYTDKMTPYIHQWKKMNLSFDGILTGFLGSRKQIEIVSDFITYFKKEKTLIIVDPIMGDHGKVYSTYTKDMCFDMRKLVGRADIITPNLTEACILTDIAYKDALWEPEEFIHIAQRLFALGPKKVVITGIPDKENLINLVYEENAEPYFSSTKKVSVERPGTGDIFASIIAADAVNGCKLRKSVNRAEKFISECLTRSEQLHIPKEDGVCFEEMLHLLTN